MATGSVAISKIARSDADCCSTVLPMKTNLTERSHTATEISKIILCDTKYISPLLISSVHHYEIWIPTDQGLQEEETRLRDQHEMLKWIYRDWHNLLHPDFIGEPESVLDCAFGTGNWAYDLAEYDPDCTVSVLHTHCLK